MEKKSKKEGVHFRIDNCPHPTFARFHKYCEEVSTEAGVNFISYPVGLKSLLDKVAPIGESEEKSEIKTFGKGDKK